VVEDEVQLAMVYLSGFAEARPGIKADPGRIDPAEIYLAAAAQRSD
jgi:hypothetical protein